MKFLLRFLLFLVPFLSLRAGDIVASSSTDQAVTLPGGSFSLQFSVTWTCDVFPQQSIPGRVDLLDSGGTLVGSAFAHVTQSGSAVSSTLGAVTTVEGIMNIMCPDLSIGDGHFAGFWNVSGLAPGNYTLRFWNYTTQVAFVPSSTIWTAATLQSVTTPAANTAPTISWTLAPGSVASGTPYTVTAHGYDADGNLAYVNVWKNGTPFAFAGGGDGTDGDSGNPTSDTGPQTVTFTAQAVDAVGLLSPVISFTVTVAAPPPVQYSLVTAANAGGTVSAGGTFDAGTALTIVATPDASHDFAGWSGDAGGVANPVSVTLDRNKSVLASFSPKTFPLTTSTSGGGGVTPGGSYPFGTVVTLTATADSVSRFSQWIGDASGTAPSIAVTMTAARAVQAVFIPKLAQSISFGNPGYRSTAAPAFPLGGSASSGLGVIYTVLSGPANIVSGQLQVTGPGAITLEASQPGDATYLAAPPVVQTFNAVAPSIVKFQPAARVLVQSQQNGTPAHLLLANP